MGATKEINEVGLKRLALKNRRNVMPRGLGGKLEEPEIYLRLNTEKAVRQERHCIGEKWK
jgi:hypothetical protein